MSARLSPFPPLRTPATQAIHQSQSYLFIQERQSEILKGRIPKTIITWSKNGATNHRFH